MKIPPGKLALRYVIYVSMIVLWFVCALMVSVHRWSPVSQDNIDRSIDARLLDFPRERDARMQADFYSAEVGGKIRLSFPEGEVPQSDCLYRINVRLKQPRGFHNFSLFDYQLWLLQSGYRATGHVKSIQRCDPVAVSTLFRVREAIALQIQSLDISNHASSTLLALLIGSYSEIDMRQWQLLRDSGTIHILSVSGLHIVLVAALAFYLFSGLSRALFFPLYLFPAAHWGGILSIVFSISYALLADFSVPTQRSLIMVAVAVSQRFFYSRFRLLASWKMALILVFLTNPLSILGCGFWFSFVGTAVLILVYHGVTGHIHWLRRYLVTNWLLFLSMLPLSLYLYGYVPVLSLPANLIAVPLISFLSLPLAFVGLVVMPFSDVLSNIALWCSALTLDGYWSLMQWLVDGTGGLRFYWGGVQPLAVFFALSGVALCLLPEGFLSRLFAFVLFLPLLLPVVYTPDKGEFEVTMLDVGQGLSLVIRTANHVLVYDAGDRFSDQFDSGGDLVLPYLRSLREPVIDMLLVSHGDKDHAGGVAGILAGMPVLRRWSGTPELLSPDAGFNPCREGMHWRWDGVDFFMLNPSVASEAGRSNNRSCVLRVANARHTVLLTGDSEQAVERRLTASGLDLHAQVLIVPHHGSKTSSSTGFIQAVNPDLALFSAGYLNRFKHPNPEVVDRYLREGAQVLKTSDQGAVRIRSRAGFESLSIETALCERPFAGFLSAVCRQDRL